MTYLANGRIFEITSLPARPSLFVYPGWDVTPELLEVTRPDGTSVPFARTILGESRWTRVDIDVVRGFLIVRPPGTDRYWWFVVDPEFHPATRALEVTDRDGNLRIDSDAPMFRCALTSGASQLGEAWPWQHHRAAGSECERLVAVYANRTEELVFVRSDYERRHRRDFALALAMMLGALAASWRANQRPELRAS